MSSQQPTPAITMVEITVLSAEGLNNYSSIFNPIRPFFKLTKLPTTASAITTVDDKPSHVAYDDGGGGGGGGDACKFRVPVDTSFFSDGYSCLHLQLFNMCRIVGPAQLGWCLIPASDIGFLPTGSVRYLSYRLRARDGSRGPAIINVCVRLDGYVPSTVETCQTVIGIPVTALRGIGNGDTSTSSNTNVKTDT